ncbi:MAG: MBOAT family protein [Verrucomicrobia bacterium]|nr:MBOAT family protein [Verrucomicrobiota bacterium]
MQFDSLFFFATLSILAGLYYPLPDKRTTWAKSLLLGYSYFFYGMWNPAFLLLLLFSSGVGYVTACCIGKYPDRKRVAIVVCLVANLGVLGFFKYWNFLVRAAGVPLQFLGIDSDPALLNIMLPVGISFFTFQTLSYAVDVYRGELKPVSSFLDVALYVAFFPQLVAGPIVRAKHFLPQLRERPDLSYRKIGDGLFWIITGLFLKSVIADNVGPRVDFLFVKWYDLSLIDTWCSAGLFGVQIYCDFAGYSLIAIGLAKILGFSIPTNFNAPYAARGFSDFWGRWHISLSTWLRDYLYIPLGGNRRGTKRTFINLMLTMLLGGLWHGASIMFVIWGGAHGLFLCTERWIRCKLSGIPRPLPGRRYLGPVAVMLTFLTVTASWIPFRAQSPLQCVLMMKNLVAGAWSFNLAGYWDVVVVGLMLLFHLASRYTDLRVRAKESRILRALTITACIVGVYFFSGRSSEFIYFQF